MDNGPALIINNNNHHQNNNNSSSAMAATKRSFNLEARFSFLNLRRQRSDVKNTDNFTQKAVVVKGL